MWGSVKGSRDYRGGALLASVLVGTGCGLPVPLDTAGAERETDGPALLAAAAAGALWGLTNAPAEALAAAKGWEAAGGDCPVRSEESGRLVLTGGCTTEEGVALSGVVRVNRVPDGGSWVFEEWEERRGDDTTGWIGNLSWVQTDGANNVTAYDFGAAWPTTGGGSAGATYPYAAFLLDDQGWAISATGAVNLLVEGVGNPGDLALAGSWAYDGCDTTPTSGVATWTAAKGEPPTSVTASFNGLACGACVPWTSTGGESGEWCQ